MPRLTLESSHDFLDLDDVLYKGKGVQALSGATGLGLPPVAVQWLEGAGDGATYRGRRVLPRDIDLPLLVQGGNRFELKQLTSRLALMLAEPCVLRLVEDDGTDWSTVVVRTGGGGYSYGNETTGEGDLIFVVTVRAGDPFFTSSVSLRKRIGDNPSTRGLLPKLSSMQLTSSQAMGEIELDNTMGDADAYPIWEVTGPGNDFRAISPTGERLHWTGFLGAADKLVVDTKAGTVVDGRGSNRYAELAAAPRFWSIPPGISTAVASLEGITNGVSKITCTWRPRRWLVI